MLSKWFETFDVDGASFGLSDWIFSSWLVYNLARYSAANSPIIANILSFLLIKIKYWILSNLFEIFNVDGASFGLSDWIFSSRLVYNLARYSAANSPIIANILSFLLIEIKYWISFQWFEIIIIDGTSFDLSDWVFSSRLVDKLARYSVANSPIIANNFNLKWSICMDAKNPEESQRILKNPRASHPPHPPTRQHSLRRQCQQLRLICLQPPLSPLSPSLSPSLPPPPPPSPPSIVLFSGGENERSE